MPPAACRRRSPGRSAEMDGEARAFGHILVTGGAGFIGSCYVRDLLGRRDGTRVTVLDKLTYAGNQANLAPVRDDPGDGRPVRLRPGRHRRSDGRRTARGGGRRGRQLRRRIARRPLDPRPGGVPVDRGHRRPRPARGVPRGARPATLPAGLDRRGLRLGRRGPCDRGRAARPALPVRGGQGGRRAARARLCRDPRRRRGRDPRLEHVRAVPPSREAHPAVRDQRARRPTAAAVRRRPPAARVAVRRRPRRRGRLRAASRRGRAGPTTSQARPSGRTARS